MDKNAADKAKYMPIFIVGTLLLVVHYALGNLSVITQAISQFLGILSPLLIGILLTYFLYIPHKYIEKPIKKIKIKKFTFISDHARGISTVIIFILLAVVIALVLAYLLPIVFNSIVELANSIPGYAQAITAEINKFIANTPFADYDIEQLLQENSASIVNSLIALMNSDGWGQAISGVMSFTNGVFNFVLGVFLALYILLYRDELSGYFTRLNNAVFSKNERRRDTVARYVSQINKVLFTFIASKGVDSLTNFAAATLIMTIFGVPYSVLLGLMAGALNFIPYIGSIISAVIITLMALLTCELPIAIGVGISMFAFQQLDGNLIEPRIMKTSLDMNPILVIMSVVIGGAYFGLVGMFLGVPIAVIITQILQEYITSTELVPEVEADDIRR